MSQRIRALWPVSAVLVSLLLSAAHAAPAPAAPAGFGGAPAPSQRSYKVDALIYDGASTAFGDAEAISAILDQHHATYKLATSDELNQMTDSDFAQYGMIVWPGGYAGQMSDSLTQATRDRIRKAVTQQGLSYVGICAGAFIAVSPDTTWGLSVITAQTLPYYHLENENVDDAMVTLDLPGGAKRSLVWWGGPTLPEVPHGVVARYSDNHEAAIVQAWAGKGMVILSGPHPEAPEDWRTKLGLTDPDGLDWDLAWQLFDAALHQQQLPAMN